LRVIGVLNWFDEEPAWLAACVASMSKLCSDVVAFDGAYGTFPTLAPRSSPAQAETIIRTADSLGMGWTLHGRPERWLGGEVEKRARLLEVAAALAEQGQDWLLVLDADEVLSDVWSGTRSQLAETDLDVADVSRTDAWNGRAPVRRLFRVLPGITCEQTHYTVTARRDGRKVYLCGEPRVHELVEALPLLDVEIVDRGEERDPDRKAAKAAYYAKAMPREQEALVGD
jgi:hypothetical protein